MTKLAFWAYVADSTYSSRFQIRIGHNSSNYFEYRNIGINNGWNYNEFDLTSPDVTVGTPNLNNIQYIATDYFYNTGEANSYWQVDDIWAYIDSTFTNYLYTQPSDSYLYGVHEIYNNDGTYEFLVNHTSRVGAAGHGRALRENATPDWFNANYDFRIVCNVGGWGHRFLFDYLDGLNFSCVYVSQKYNKIGVEQYIDNVRNYDEVAFTPSVDTVYSVEIRVRGQDVTVYLDGEQMLVYTLAEDRTVGGFGLESYGSSDLTKETATAFRNLAVSDYGKETVFKYNIRALASQILLIKYNIKSLISKSLIVKYNILALAAKELIVKYNIIAHAAKELIVKYNLLNKAAKELILKYKLRSATAKELIIKYRIWQLPKGLVKLFGITPKGLTDRKSSLNETTPKTLKDDR